MQRRDERLPLHPAGLAVPARGEQLLELVNNQDQTRQRGSCGIGRCALSWVRCTAGGRSHRMLDQHWRLTRCRRQRLIHRNRIGTRNVGERHSQFPQRTTCGLNHLPRPPARPQPQGTGRQQRHQPRPQQRRLARPGLPGHQQYPRPVQLAHKPRPVTATSPRSLPPAGHRSRPLCQTIMAVLIRCLGLSFAAITYDGDQRRRVPATRAGRHNPRPQDAKDMRDERPLPDRLLPSALLSRAGQQAQRCA